MIHQITYDKQQHEERRIDESSLKKVLSQLRNSSIKKATVADVKCYLRTHRLHKYYEAVLYFQKKLEDPTSTELGTPWEILWDNGRRVTTILALYKLWWARMPHYRRYCINPHKFAEALWSFSQGGLKSLPETDGREVHIKDLIYTGFVRHHCVKKIQRSWREYAKAKCGIYPVIKG